MSRPCQHFSCLQADAETVVGLAGHIVSNVSARLGVAPDRERTPKPENRAWPSRRFSLA